MVPSLTRKAGIACVLALIASLFTVSTADASVTYTSKGTAQLYDIVEADYVLNDTRIVVLSNDTSNAVIQLVNPTTRTVTDTLAFTVMNADETNPWTDATDMAISADGQTAYVTFAGSNYALAKITLSTLSVADYVSISGENAIYGSGAPEFVALRGSAVWAFSRGGGKSFATAGLGATGTDFTAGPEAGVTIRGFVSDPVASKTFWPDITDGSISGNSRILFLGDNATFYAANFGVQSVATALALNEEQGEIYVGTTYSGSDFLAQIDGYLNTNYLSQGDNLELRPAFGGVRQIVTSADNTQLVALSSNGQIARMPLGRGWLSSLIDYYTLTSADVTLGSNSAIAIKSDGSQVTYLDSRTGAQDNIINIALANNPATVSTAPQSLSWYAQNKKTAHLSWDAPIDNGGSQILDYSVQCTNGKTRTFKTVKTAEPGDDPDATVKRNAKKKIKCRVLARNAEGFSEVSNVITVTAQGKRGPGPF